MPSLEGTPREEAAVEERNFPEGACRGGAVARRRVQGSEEQWQQHTRMETTPVCHARVVTPREKGAVGVEPTFRFEERQEEHARHAQQSQLGAVRGVRDRERVRQRVGERLNTLFEDAVEASRHRLPSQQLTPARVHQEVVADAVGDQKRERLGVAGDNTLPLRHERHHARRALG